MNGDELFDELFYPGSRHERRQPVAPAPKVKDDLAWDARPLVKDVKGVPTELFTIGALAKALGRELVTVRLWERKGHLPKALYRTPNKNGLGGRRMYTRAQIDALLRIAAEHELLDTPRIEWSKHRTFGAEVARAWAELHRAT